MNVHEFTTVGLYFLERQIISSDLARKYSKKLFSNLGEFNEMQLVLLKAAIMKQDIGVL
jgi:hypothetical protein